MGNGDDTFQIARHKIRERIYIKQTREVASLHRRQLSQLNLRLIEMQQRLRARHFSSATSGVLSPPGPPCGHLTCRIMARPGCNPGRAAYKFYSAAARSGTTSAAIFGPLQNAAHASMSLRRFSRTGLRAYAASTLSPLA